MFFGTVIAGLFAGAAAAQTSDPSSFVLQGSVAGVCTATSNTDPLTLPSMAAGAENGASIIYTCNAPAGFSRTISSQNNGRMLRQSTSGGAGNEVAYTIRHSSFGTPGLGLASGTSLGTPVVTSHAGALALVTGVNETLTATLPTPMPALFAGQYQDVITVSVSPNP
jgi:hypothetical protein